MWHLILKHLYLPISALRKRAVTFRDSLIFAYNKGFVFFLFLKQPVSCADCAVNPPQENTNWPQSLTLIWRVIILTPDEYRPSLDFYFNSRSSDLCKNGRFAKFNKSRLLCMLHYCIDTWNTVVPWPLLLFREFLIEISIILSAKEVILKVLISLSLDNWDFIGGHMKY